MAIPVQDCAEVGDLGGSTGIRVWIVSGKVGKSATFTSDTGWTVVQATRGLRRSVHPSVFYPGADFSHQSMTYILVCLRSCLKCVISREMLVDIPTPSKKKVQYETDQYLCAATTLVTEEPSGGWQGGRLWVHSPALFREGSLSRERGARDGYPQDCCALARIWNSPRVSQDLKWIVDLEIAQRNNGATHIQVV